jgi:hypothetical protein
MDTIKYQVNGIFEIIFGCLSDIINSITSFFDYLLIERELVLIGLLFVMYFTMCIKTIPIAVELWDNRKEKETSRLQTIKFNKTLVSTILSFAVIAFLYTGLSQFYINSNLTTEIDDVVLVDKKFKGDKINDESMYVFDITKFISKRGYSITCFDGVFKEAYFNYGPLKGTSVRIDNDVFSDSNKLNKDPKNFKFKYYFYKKGSRTPRMIVVESE